MLVVEVELEFEQELEHGEPLLLSYLEPEVIIVL